MDIPVYMFTGFLESGKTKFIQETLEDERFNDGQRTLLIVTEEGEEEYNPELFASNNVYIEYIDSPENFTVKTLKYLQSKYNIRRVMIEYNGMWLHDTLYNNLPKNWMVYQEFMFAEYSTFINYNSNMRSLMFDKIKSCELVVINRVPDSFEKTEIHKIIRGISRQCDIAYEHSEGQVEYDDIEDPLPFDINADPIVINDKDYAYWYRDLTEDPSRYENKNVQFTAIVAKNKKLPRGTIAVGRHMMTCCVQDISYASLLCYTEKADELNMRDWIQVTGKINLKYSDVYNGKGPVLSASKIIPCPPPEKEVATFY